MFVRTQKVQNTVSTFSKGTPRPADDDPTLRVIISVIGCRHSFFVFYSSNSFGSEQTAAALTQNLGCVRLLNKLLFCDQLLMLFSILYLYNLTPVLNTVNEQRTHRRR